mmetsp:Transcript_64281/g.179798  ORF Transcript_64281/g.179798 Transcript_64281/m.179798 type:complete len:218 (-) Transcript_64281:8-661(-)
MSPADQGHGLLVAEAHAAEDAADVLRGLLPTLDAPLLVDLHALVRARLRARQPPRGDGLGLGGVAAAAAELDDGAGRVLDGAVSGEDPEVRGSDRRVLVLHRLQELPRDLEPGVLRVAGLQRVPHRRAVRPPRPVGLAVRARGVPREADQQGGEAAVVVLRRVHHLQDVRPNRVVVDGVNKLAIRGGTDARLVAHTATVSNAQQTREPKSTPSGRAP